MVSNIEVRRIATDVARLMCYAYEERDLLQQRTGNYALISDGAPAHYYKALGMLSALRELGIKLSVTHMPDGDAYGLNVMFPQDQKIRTFPLQVQFKHNSEMEQI